MIDSMDIIVILCIVLLYLFFTQKRIIISEDMVNTETHKNDDYNV